MSKKKRQTDPRLEEVLKIGRDIVGERPNRDVPQTIRIKARTIEDTKFALTIGLFATYTIINYVAYKRNGTRDGNGHAYDGNIWSFLGSYNGRIFIQGASQALKVALTK